MELQPMNGRAASDSAILDVAIVGAGPAGIGMALALDDLPSLRLRVFEGGRIGESFRRWPRQTRFITPSFDAHAFSLVDLNAVDSRSSPADASGVEHLSGRQYADYLASLVAQHRLPVCTDCQVESLAAAENDLFTLSTSHGVVRARTVVWATGEFQFPDRQPFPGSEACIHYADVSDWRSLTGDTFTVIGGSESAIDATVNLIESGRRVRLLTRQAPQSRPTSRDPSETLSPHTRARFLALAECTELEVITGCDIARVRFDESTGYRIDSADGRRWQSATAPILGTGFQGGGGARAIAECWDWHADGRVRLTACDESTRTPGLFLVGPQVNHAGQNFCFVYKFRQRFTAVRARIIEQLGAGLPRHDADRWALTS